MGAKCVCNLSSYVTATPGVQKARDGAAAGRARTGACAAAWRMHVCSWAAGPMRSFSFRSVNQQEERLLPGMLAS